MEVALNRLWTCTWIRVLAGVVLGLLPTLAQSAEPVKLTLTSVRVVQENKEGQPREIFQPALAVKPGDVLEWRLEAENTTERPLRQVVLVIPIPRETRYLEGSALALERGNTRLLPLFSYDGGQTYGLPPLKRKVKVNENGKELEKEVEVKPEEYTHARWVLPELAPKEKVLLKLRTIVR